MYSTVFIYAYVPVYVDMYTCVYVGHMHMNVMPAGHVCMPMICLHAHPFVVSNVAI